MRVELKTMVVGLAVLAGCSAAQDNADGVAQANSVGRTADNCLDGQDLNAPDVDISKCPTLPRYPESVRVGNTNVSLGSWEIGTTADGETYKFGGLQTSSDGTATLSYSGGTTQVDAENLACWAKGYYRLRHMLKDPPREWTALRDAGFQTRFFQFQTDLRNGPTGYRRISSYMDHLVKWVTVVNAQGACEQPTLQKFRDYAKRELANRDLPLPSEPDAGAPDASAQTDASAESDASTGSDAGAETDASDEADAGPAN